MKSRERKDESIVEQRKLYEYKTRWCAQFLVWCVFEYG